MLVETANTPIAAEAPRARAPAAPTPPVSQATVQPRRSDALDRVAEPGRVAEPARSEEASSRSRLAYDDELSRVFVEIVDPDSGEVVQRFPPEQIVRHIKALIEEAGFSANRDGTGILVDQSV